MSGDLSLALGHVQQLHAAGRTAEAERLCRELVTAHPSSAAALNALALVLKGRGALTGAEEVMRKALALAPQDAALHNNLGNILRQRNEPAAAEQAYRRAVALNRDYAEAYYNLGIVLGEAGRKEEALAAHRRAVALKPGYADALAQIGALLTERGQPQDALSALDAGANTSHAAVHYWRGAALTALERHDMAVDAFRRAAGLNSASYEAQFALGNALVRAHREAEALEAYARAAVLQPRFLEAHRAFSLLAWSLGEKTRVGETYALARGKLGDDPDLLLAESALRLRLGEAEAAADLARHAGSRPDAAILLGQALTAQRRFDEAIPLLAGAVRERPDEIAAHRELGVAYLQSAQTDSALRVLAEAHARAPDDQLILAFLTLAQREADEVAYAQLVDFDKYVRTFEIPEVDGLTPVLEALHTRRSEPLDQTLRGGTQTAGSLFAENAPGIVRLREAIRARVAGYIRDLPDDPDHPFLRRKRSAFAFAGSWSCLLRSSGYHTNHVHQQGWISSALYVSLPDAVMHGEQGWLKFGESNLALGARDAPARMVQPSVGKLVLFPSYYWHGTVPFTDTAARLTVAFDVVPR